MTMQISDELMMDNKFMSIEGLRIPKDHPLIEVSSEKYVTRYGSACWRECESLWLIEDNKLYLKYTEGRFKLKESPIFADWFTGKIKIIDYNLPREFIFCHGIGKILLVEKGIVMGENNG